LPPVTPYARDSARHRPGRHLLRSSIIEGDTYLLACHRYIELNPVRAQMVEEPGDYPWSSYGANALGRADAVVSPHPLYSALHASDEGRRQAYRNLFADSLPEPVLSAIRDATNSGFCAGQQSV
jgi:putative transposase